MIENLVETLKKEFSLKEEQTRAGLALLLKFCEEKLSSTDFSKITTLLGEGWKELYAKAPNVSGGMAAKFGAFASLVGADKMGAMAKYANGFKSIGFDMKQIQPFIKSTIKALEEKGGPEVRAMLKKFLG